MNIQAPHNMKKILCLTDCLGSGGAQRQMVGLTIMLKRLGYDIRVVTYHNVAFYKHQLDDNGVKNITIPEANIVSRLVYLKREVDKFSPDILIAYQESPSLMACLLKLFKNKLKLIVSERTTTQTLDVLTRLRFNLYRLSDCIVPNSFSQANFIVSHYPNLKRKVNVITNFVDTQKFVPLHSDNPIPVITVVASEKKEKNFNRFIESLSILKNRDYKFRAQWYGINSQYVDQHRQYVCSKDLSDIFTVHTPHTNILEVYQKTDIFCLPSLFEGFPNALCEAMSCGLPLAASNVCDNPQIVINGENGYLFNPYSSEDIADKLALLLNMDSNQLNTIRVDNRKRAEDIFSEETFIRNYQKIID